MNPEWLPETALLLAGLIASAIALRLLFAREPSRALRVSALGLACIALAFALGKTHGDRPDHEYNGRRMRKPPKSIGLLPQARPSTSQGFDPTPSMSLSLGQVLLRVAPSDRYVFSVDGQQFLELDSLRSGLMVECAVGVDGRFAATVSRNLFPFYRSGIQPVLRPDPHTLLVRDGKRDVLRVHYATPNRIEVTGDFFTERSESSLVSFQEGIHWPGGGIPPGTTIDLRNQGRGTIDFERSGLIRILPIDRRP